MDDITLLKIASRIAAKPKKEKKEKSKGKKVSRAPVAEVEEQVFVPEDPGMEYSCLHELSFSVDFNGHADRQKLMNRLKKETKVAIESAVRVVCNEMNMTGKNLVIRPFNFECTVNDNKDTEY